MSVSKTLFSSELRVPSVALAMLALGACQSTAPAPVGPGGAIPVYSKQTGRLEQLLSDKNGDGKIDTRAYMDGLRIKHIEIDLRGDERPDRWEYYLPSTETGRSGAAAIIDRAEEASGADGRITRREFYVKGVIQRVEEDTDRDGRTDKWEQYEAGQLTRVDLDLLGKGFANRRLVYRADGTFERVEEDPDGDGKFVVPPSARKGGDPR